MSDIDDNDVWVDSEEDEDEQQEHGSYVEDATFFLLELKPEAEPGGFHTRNRPGENQRIVASQFYSGPRKRPAFNVGSTAKCIIHGTLDQVSHTPATLLVYDFVFFSHRSARIKDAVISFEFKSKRGSTSPGPTVKRVAPFGKHVTDQTTETVTKTLGVDGGISGGAGLTVNANLHKEKSVEMTSNHAIEIVGNNPCDEWSNCFLAQWSLEENRSQRKGIVSRFRACILLTRDNKEEEFRLLPTVKVTPDLKTRLGSLVAFRRDDEAIKMVPASAPINTLERDLVRDRWNLGSVDLDDLWGCKFHNTFEEAVEAPRLHTLSS